jgi:glyoxylase-like metal-dependent hydrolase (beta-lactamase superfamily II)
VSQVAPAGLHLIELPHDDRRTVNAILIEGQPLTLVDTGLGHPASLAALTSGLGRLGYRLAEIEQLVITHAHLDHFGAAAAIVRASGARVLADAGGLAEMAQFGRHFKAAQGHRLMLFQRAGAPAELIETSRRWGDHYATLGEPVVADGGLVEGDVIELGGGRWRVISVPGHAASSIALYDAERHLLLSGDIVVTIGAANVTLHHVGEGRQPAGWQLTIMASLERLRRLPLRWLYPGHGEVSEAPLALIDDRLQRAEARLRQVWGLLQAGPLTAYELSLALYQPPVGTSSLGLSQALGYIDALAARGLVVADERAAVQRYRVVTDRSVGRPTA